MEYEIIDHRRHYTSCFISFFNHTYVIISKFLIYTYDTSEF